MSIEYKYTGKTMTLKTNIATLDRALKAIDKYIEPKLYEVEQQTFWGSKRDWWFKFKVKIKELQDVDSDDDGHPIQQFNCPPFIEAEMNRNYVGMKFDDSYWYTISHVQKMTNGRKSEKIMEYTIGRKYESIINLLIILKVAGKNVDTILKRVIFEALNKRYETNIKSIELAGVDDIVKDCKRILDCSDPRLVSRHILLAGPPGCGKSEIVKKLIKDTPEWVHYTLNNDIRDWLSFMRNLDKLMQYIDKKVMIIVDEIDEIALSRDHPESKVFDLLRVLDGVNDVGYIKFVATTNRPKVLDPALKRIGRFGPIVVMSKPDTKTFEKIVKFYAKRYGATDIDIKELLKIRGEATGSEIRAAFENCIINAEPITTDKIITNLERLEVSKKMEYEDFV